MLTPEKKAILDRAFHHDKCLLGRDKLWKFCASKYPDAMVSRRDTMEYLKQDPTWQKTAPPPVRVPTKQIAFDKPGAYQCDLTGPLHQDQGFEYIFGIVEASTRKMYVRPLKNKEASTVAAALKSIVEENDLKMSIIFSDNGTEMKQEFTEFLKSIDCKQWFNQPHSPWQNSLIETRWKHVKRMLYKNELDTGSKAWVNVLPTLVENLNSVPTRTLRVAPNDAHELPDGVRIDRLKAGGKVSRYQRGVKSALKLGDFVRLRLRKKAFKGLKQTYSDEVYLVTKVIKATDSKIVTYKISEDGSEKKGTYNITDLLKVDNRKPPDRSRLIEPDGVGERSIMDQKLVDELAERTEQELPEVRETRRPKPDASGEYEVEAILGTRKFGKTRKYLVKWKGYPREDATFEPAKNISAKKLLKEFQDARKK